MTREELIEMNEQAKERARARLRREMCCNALRWERERRRGGAHLVEILGQRCRPDSLEPA